MEIGTIFSTMNEYDEAYLFVKEHEGTTIKDLGDGKYQLIELPKPTIEQLSAKKRIERDRILAETDVKMLPDFPITEEEKELWIKYRQYLRDLPESADFPNVEVLTFEDWNK